MGLKQGRKEKGMGAHDKTKGRKTWRTMVRFFFFFVKIEKNRKTILYLLASFYFLNEAKCRIFFVLFAF